MKERIEKFLTSNKVYVSIFVGGILCSFLLWATGLFVNGVHSNQMNLFFRHMSDFLADFLNHVGYSGDGNPYNDLIYTGFDHKQQPPLAYLFFFLFSNLVENFDVYQSQDNFLNLYTEPLFLFMLILFYCVNFIIIYELIRSNKNGGGLTKNLTAFAIILSAPVLGTLERGNHTIFACLFFMVFIFYRNDKSRIIREIAIISLAISAALKLSPAFAGIFLLSEKRWKDSLRCFIYGVLLLVLPTLFFDGGIQNFVYFIRNSIISAREHSILQGYSIAACIYDMIPGEVLAGLQADSIYVLFRIINYAGCVVFLVGAMVLPKKWQKLFSISLVIVSIQGHAGGYCFMYFIPAMVLFLNDEHEKYDIVILFALLCIMCPFQNLLKDIFFYQIVGEMIIIIYIFVVFIKEIVRYFFNNRLSKKNC